jgi:hypothetical protein
VVVCGEQGADLRNTQPPRWPWPLVPAGKADGGAAADLTAAPSPCKLTGQHCCCSTHCKHQQERLACCSSARGAAVELHVAGGRTGPFCWIGTRCCVGAWKVRAMHASSLPTCFPPTYLFCRSNFSMSWLWGITEGQQSLLGWRQQGALVRDRCLPQGVAIVGLT